MVFNAAFNNISIISWWSVYWFRKPEYPEKTTDLSQVTDSFFQICHFFLSHWRTYTKLSFYYAIANLYFRNVQLVSMDMHVIRGASVQANMDVIMWLVHVIVGQDLLDQNVMPHAHQGRKYSNLFPGLRKCSMQMSNLLWLKCWTVIKYVLFHYLNLCLSVMLDSRLCSFTWICV
jgi:hypothetical protein